MTISDSNYCDNVDAHVTVRNTSALMPIELNAETVMPLSVAARLLPPIRGDKPPHYLTLVRWATNGVRTVGDEQIVLETFFIGSTRVTTAAALRQFCERITAARNSVESPRKRRPRESKRK